MGRRSEHSREELHQLIVEAALKLVQKQGADKVTARQIAKAVGYTPGMLYSIFANQQDILLHVNAVGLDTLLQHCVSARNSADSPRASILAMGLAYLKFAERHTHQFELMFKRMKEEVPLPPTLSSRIQSLFALVEEDLRALRPDAEEEQLRSHARALWSGVHGAAALSLNDQLYLEGEHADRVIIDVLISAFLHSWCSQDPTAKSNP